MHLKRLIFRAAIRIMESLFKLRGFNRVYHSNVCVAPVQDAGSIDVVTIAFNNPKMIELQAIYVKKYLKKATYIVVDNSNDMEKSFKIRQICEKEKIGYAKLPKNIMQIFGNYSHGTAVNWAYKHIIKPRGAFGFGIIDHDIFPVKNIDISLILNKQPIYGAKRKRNGVWYLSAIVSFFKTSFVNEKKFDFLPITVNGTYLDTGGGNWSTMYKYMNEDELQFMDDYTISFKKGNDRFEDQIELFDNEKWVHSINGSNWKKVDVVKEEIIQDLITKYESI